MKNIILTAVLLLTLTDANATLIDLQNGLIYDNVSNVYWTQDAFLSPIDTWFADVAWAQTASVAGLSGFRLASLSEYENLYKQLRDLGVCRPGIPVLGFDCTGSVGPFRGIYFEYWSSTIQGGNPIFFDFAGFGAGPNFFTHQAPGWAVRPVPEPNALWITIAGLAAVAWARYFFFHASRKNRAGRGLKRRSVLHSRWTGMRLRRSTSLS